MILHLLHDLDIMGRGRKKTAILPGRTCGPCHLCGQRRTQDCRTATWDNKMKEKLKEISEVTFNHCICRACEKVFERNVGSEGYKPRWRSENKENNGFSRCTVKPCTQLSRIIHTNILTRDKIVELLQVKLLNEPQLNYYNHSTYVQGTIKRFIAYCTQMIANIVILSVTLVVALFVVLQDTVRTPK